MSYHAIICSNDDKFIQPIYYDNKFIQPIHNDRPNRVNECTSEEKCTSHSQDVLMEMGCYYGLVRTMAVLVFV